MGLKLVFILLGSALPPQTRIAKLKFVMALIEEEIENSRMKVLRRESPVRNFSMGMVGSLAHVR